MAKTTTKPRVTKPRVQNKKIENTQIEPKRINNGLGGAIGFSDNNYTGLPYGVQLSQTDTLYKNNRWYFISNMRQLLSESYVEQGLIQTIIDVPVDDGLRGGVDISSKQLSEEQIQELQVSLDRDDDINTVGQALKWNRLFGGAGLLIMTDQDSETPLDMEAIGPDSPLEFRAVDLWELFYSDINASVEGYDVEAQYQDFEFYNYYSKVLHKSRVMRMVGLVAPSFVRPRMRGWGFSVVESLVRSINQYLKATDLSFEVLDEFKIDVYKIKNLTDTLISPDGESQVARRIRMANFQKNYQNALVMDSEDDFDHKQINFGGISDMMEQIRMQIASDMRIPMIKLFGQGPNGLNASGEDEIEVYNSMVESQVRNKCKYDILRMIEFKCQKMFGFIPDDISIEFKPLRVLSSVDEETVKSQKFNRLYQAKMAGLITTYEFREACNRDNLLGVNLDTSGDMLNPDDPEIQAVLEGVAAQPDSATEDGSPSPYDTSGPSQEDPGSNREDTGQVITFDRSAGGSGKTKKNSALFDVASYKADGGDGWISDQRASGLIEIYKKDQALWSRAQEASRKSFGKEKPKFMLWYYKKYGGK